MRKGEATRAAVIDEALRQAISRGLEGISLNGVASVLGLSKSGLFAHFVSKEALQLAVLDTAIDRFARSVVLPAAGDGRALDRLERLFVGLVDWLRGDTDTPGCLFSSMVQEYDDRPGPIRDRLVAAQAEWRSLLASVVAAAVGEGDLPKGTDPAQIAFEIVGIGSAFHQTYRLFHDPSAYARALTAFRRLLSHP